jgi:hypothetical protein
MESTEIMSNRLNCMHGAPRTTLSLNLRLLQPIVLKEDNISVFEEFYFFNLALF